MVHHADLHPKISICQIIEAIEPVVAQTACVEAAPFSSRLESKVKYQISLAMWWRVDAAVVAMFRDQAADLFLPHYDSEPTLPIRHYAVLALVGRSGEVRQVDVDRMSAFGLASDHRRQQRVLHSTVWLEPLFGMGEPARPGATLCPAGTRLDEGRSKRRIG